MKLKKLLMIIVIVLLAAVAFTVSYYFNMNQNAKPVAAMDKLENGNAVTEGTLSGNENENEPVLIEEKEEPLTIVAVGDILLGRGVGSRLVKAQKDYKYPFEKVVGFLKEGDVVFGNLEEPITDSSHSLIGIHQGGKYVLKNDVEAFEGIKYAGFNLLSLANNHILDYYDKGLYDTLEILDRNNIAHSGAGKNLEEARKPAIIEKKGLKIGMLSYTDMAEVLYKGNPPLRFIAEKERYGVAPRKYDYIKEDVEKAREEVDILIVALHWGVEESFEILPEQVDLSHKLLDQGVDVILGHHPHQFHGIEIYKGKPVIYSLGNFIFDQNDPENQEAFIVDMKFEEKKLSSLSALPIRTIGKTQVVPVVGKDAEELLNRELELCRKLDSKCDIQDGKVIFDVTE